MTVGICDWGVGGLCLYKALRAGRPDLDIVYVADQGAGAYNLLSREALTERVEQVILTFRAMGIPRVVMACDSASTVLDAIAVPGVNVTGVLEPTLRAMRHRSYREVGIIGGRRTILSGAYGRSLRKQRFMVVQRVSEDLANLIESGQVNTPEIMESVRDMLEPLAKVDGLLLANTHYPLVASSIREALPNTEIIDPSVFTVSELISDLPEFSGNEGKTTFYSTGNPMAMKASARMLFGLNINVRSLSIAEPKLAA